MKILLINPPNREVYGIIKKMAPNYPPIGLGYLGAVLHENGHNVVIFDTDIEDLTLPRIIEKCKSYNPDMVGITSTTPAYPLAIKIATGIKETHDVPIVLGGYHASALPDEVLSSGVIDYVVIGEGEITLKELADNLKEPHRVKGLAFRDGREVVRTPPRSLIDNLDILPFPWWEDVDFSKYQYADSQKKPIAAVLTSRGCPFGCLFCSKVINGRTFRARSPENVVDEIEFLVNRYGIKEIHILDDLFAFDRNRAIKICDMILNRGIDVAWNCTSGIRVDGVDKELLQKMKDAGCYRIAYGIETGNPVIMESIMKNITLSEVENAVKLTKEVGIETWGYFMIGLPGETRNEVIDTINFATRLDVDIAKFAITIPFPGTFLFNELKEQDLIITYDWSRFGLHTDNPVHNLPGLSGEEIIELRKAAYKKFYLRPSYIIKKIPSIIIDKSKRDFYTNALKTLLTS